MIFFLSGIASAEQTIGTQPVNETDSAFVILSNKKPVSSVFPENKSLPFSKRFIHRIGFEARPEYIIPTNSFFRGENDDNERINQSFSAHLRYSFQYHPNTRTDQVYGGAYQGIGITKYTFHQDEHIGSPFAFYLFQGARIAGFTPRLSLNYEWNLGLSFGWHPYGWDDNYFNRVIGSKANAYINANFYLNYMLSKQFDLTAGVALTHFSNGNTKLPNAGLNTTGAKIGLVYNFNRKSDVLYNPIPQYTSPEFFRHISYDLVLFGSWRRKIVDCGNEQIVSSDAYTVFGFNFAPMYNLGYRLRIGISADGVYDGSANVYQDENDYYTFRRPSIDKQLALGLSGRTEYVMPYFTVGLGMGANVLHKGGDLKSFYQIFALKIDVTRNAFLHIGYSLHAFHNPNFLMLGIGYRFNNKSRFYRP